jgi:Subtilase family/LGFP repeat
MTAIDDKHAALLSSGVLNLGSPVGPEEELYDGGSVRQYEFGRIYFHPRVGAAFELHGLILATYLEQGAELSGLGYPVTDETDAPGVAGGRMNNFELGSMVFDPVSGVDVRFAEPVLLPQVIVKVEDGIFVPLGPGGRLSLDRFVADIAGPDFEFVVELVRSLLPNLAFRRLFDSATGDEIQFLLDEARANDPEFAPPDFNNFLVIVCPPGFDTETLAGALSQLQGVVEYAYTAPVASDPAVSGTPNALFNRQGYLTPAPAGIGVQAAWARGADGAGTEFIDLEQGWFLGHEDLPKGIRLIEGQNRKGSFPHGAAVLGEVVGIDNTRGVCGIAPQTAARVISYFRLNEAFNAAQSRQTLADMLWRAQSQLSFGDVLLIEAQFEGQISGVNRLVPVETDRVVWEVIRFATRRNVIVVEAAGNGNANLDDFIDHRGRRALNRVSGEFRDSGAIMVGSCTAKAPHTRILTPAPGSGGSPSNFGTRIDCHAWGENVVTCGSFATPTKPDAYFTGPFFGGTSSAAPVIAGVCLLTQNLFQTLNPATGGPGKLSAARMRRVLTDPSNTTTSAPGASIGVMPDLRKLIAHEFI